MLNYRKRRKDGAVQKIKPAAPTGLILVNPSDDRFVRANVLMSGELTEIVAFPDIVLIDTQRALDLGDAWDGLLMVNEDNILAVIED